MIREATVSSQSSIPWRAYAAMALGIGCLTWGTFFVRWAAVPSPVSSFYRLAIAALVLTPLWLVRRRQNVTRQALLWAAAAGLFFALDLVFWNAAILVTSAANATLLGNSAPIWVGLGALFFFRERLSGRFWGGMLIAVAGAVIVLGNHGLPGQAINPGDLLALGAGGFYAAYLLTIQRVRTQLDTLSGLTMAVLTGVAFTTLICIATGAQLSGFSLQTWASLLGLGLISQVAGALAINYALGHIRATIASVTMLAQPALTGLLAIPLLGEQLGLAQIGGGALILTGIYLVSGQRQRTNEQRN